MFFFLTQSSLSPEQFQEFEREKLDSIAKYSLSLLDLKKKQADLIKKKQVDVKNKSTLIKKKRLEEYAQQRKELDTKEKELCRKTNQLVDELVETCDDSQFHKALIKILGNLKGNYVLSILYFVF